MPGAQIRGDPANQIVEIVIVETRGRFGGLAHQHGAHSRFTADVVIEQIAMGRIGGAKVPQVLELTFENGQRKIFLAKIVRNRHGLRQLGFLEKAVVAVEEVLGQFGRAHRRRPLRTQKGLTQDRISGKTVQHHIHTANDVQMGKEMHVEGVAHALGYGHAFLEATHQGAVFVGAVQMFNPQRIGNFGGIKAVVTPVFPPGEGLGRYARLNRSRGDTAGVEPAAQRHPDGPAVSRLAAHGFNQSCARPPAPFLRGNALFRRVIPDPVGLPLDAVRSLGHHRARWEDRDAFHERAPTRKIVHRQYLGHRQRIDVSRNHPRQDGTQGAAGEAIASIFLRPIHRIQSISIIGRDKSAGCRVPQHKEESAVQRRQRRGQLIVPGERREQSQVGFRIRLRVPATLKGRAGVKFADQDSPES